MELLTQKDIEDVTWKVINKYVIPDFESRKHNASGKWLKSLSVRTEENKGVIRGMDYTYFLAEGRNPNQNQDPEAIKRWARWAGKNIFEQWAADKGLSVNPYAVAYKIAREGTNVPRGNANTFLDVLESQEVMDFILEELKVKVIVNFTETLRNSIRNLKKA